jgi:hypothetical protein
VHDGTLPLHGQEGTLPLHGQEGLDSLSCARPGVHVPAVCAGQRNQQRCAEGTRKGGQHTINHGRVSLSIHTLVYAFGCQHHGCMQRWCAASAHTQGRARCTDACITLQEHHQQHKGLSAWHYMPTHTPFSVPGLARSEGVGNQQTVSECQPQQGTKQQTGASTTPQRSKQGHAQTPAKAHGACLTCAFQN